METIVVGVDGSGCAGAALEFAIEEAVLRKTRLRIVAAWQVPAAAYGGGFAPLDDGVFESFRQHAEAVVKEAAEATSSREAALECETRVEEGQPAAILLEHAKDATLIVVGKRGLGGFKSLRLGSVSRHVVHHAGCPVVVVRQPLVLSR